MKVSEDTELFIHKLKKMSMSMNEYFVMSIGDDDIISKVLNSFTEYYEELVYSIHIQMNIQIEISLDYLKE